MLMSRAEKPCSTKIRLVLGPRRERNNTTVLTVYRLGDDAVHGRRRVNFRFDSALYF